tara:strand:- start:2915 stop:3619 length:705 start_codon:yes stop_codon:yes gene_type:complete
MVTKEHISSKFDAELEDIRNSLMQMGGLVEKQLSFVVEALAKGDADLAEEIVDTEESIDRMEMAIDEQCMRIIARRQPTAGDLRLVISISKTVAELEAIGDDCKRIGYALKDIIDKGYDKSMLLPARHLGNSTKTMVKRSLDNMARLDADAALSVLRSGDDIDTEYEALMRQLVTFMMEDSRSVPKVLDAIWIARSFERIASRAFNMSHHCIFLVAGKDLRHRSIDDVEAAISD